MPALNLNSTVKLNNGVEMPVLGLGTFQSERGRATQDAVRWALEAGYRHIDTAAIYGNEEDVGLGIRDSGVPRKDIFITTKLWNGDQEYDAALRGCDASLKRLGVDAVDLYLIHWPIRGTRAGAWKALLRIYEEGKARAIGVSNYTVRHLNELLAGSPVDPGGEPVRAARFQHPPGAGGCLPRARHPGGELQPAGARQGNSITRWSLPWPPASTRPRRKSSSAGRWKKATWSFPSRSTASASWKTARSSTFRYPPRISNRWTA